MTRILVVDDNPDNLYFLQALLTGHGYEVETALHGAEALVRARSTVPDLVISDLLMPVMDGYTLLRHWKADSRLSAAPFVVYTATYTDPDDERLAYALGADDFLLKPTEPDALLARIRDVLHPASGDTPSQRSRAVIDEPDLLKVYSQTLMRKLEEKTLQLTEANVALREEAVERQRMSETQTAILASLDEGVTGLSAAGAVIFENPAAIALLGGRTGEAIGKDAHTLFHHHHADGTPYPADDCPIIATLRDGIVRRVDDEHFFRRDGTGFPVAYSCAPLRDPGGAITGAVLSFRDVTEAQRVQRALHDQSTLLESAQRIARMGSWSMDVQQKKLRWSETTCELFGIPPEAFLETYEHFYSFILPEDRAAYDAVHARVGPESSLLEAEYRIRRPDGSVRWMYERGDVEYDAGGRQIRRLGVVMDVTVERESRERLEQSLSLLMIAGRVARIGGWSIELPSRVLTWSDEVSDIHDLPRGRHPTLEEGLSLFAPESRQDVVESVTRCIETGVPYDLEFEKVTATGRQISVRSIGEAVRDAEGAIVRIQGALQDITEQKRAAESLRESEERFRQLAETINEVFWISAPDKNELLYISPAYATIWGRPCEELYTHPENWLKAIHPEDRDAVARALPRQALGEYDVTYRVVRPDGSVRWVHDRGFPVRDAHGVVYRIVGIAADITERREIETQFLRAQRMESIGTLAGGIAHDLNNVLTPILMSVELLRGDPPPAVKQQILTTVEKSATQGAELIRQVLSFARGVGGKRVPVSVERVVQDVASIVHDTFPKAIRLELGIPPGIPTVVGDPNQLHQVLLNLCVNARDAMPSGGVIRLTVSTQASEDLPGPVPAHVKPGEYVTIEVLDTGTGMPSSVVDRIFEPFYTTKEHGQGTGLGLSTSLAIVRSHGGLLSVTSAPGEGSSFLVALPVPTAIVVDPEPRARPEGRIHGHDELILVVDDEEAIRAITRRLLEAYGYRVLIACGGEEAMKLYLTNRDQIRAVITDLQMPGMDGTAIIRAMMDLDPGVRVVAVSGMMEVAQLPEAGGHLHLLPKPYTADELLTVLDTVINEQD